MFKVGNLKINFKHEYFYVSEKTGEPVYEGTGRFGVTCFIYQEGVEEAISVGSVLIHKGDQPDRIIGKKYALRKALIKKAYFVEKRHVIIWQWDKHMRTKIWDAFWDWIESWDKKKKVEFVGCVDRYQPYLNPTLSTNLEIKSMSFTDNTHKNIISIINKKIKITLEEI